MHAESSENHRKFLSDHCIKCHGPDKSKAKLRLDLLKWDAEDADSIEIWQEIIDQLEEGEMPPEDEKQPSEKEVATIVNDIKTKMKSIGTTSQVILRRLSKKQYRNTIRDLLKIDTQQFNPALAFPEDEKIHGFDNNSEALLMSDFLLSKALKASRKIVDHATYPSEKPEIQKYEMGQTPSKKLRERHFWSNFPVLKDGTLNLYQNDEKEPGDTRGLSLISSYNGVPHNGYYEFKFDLASLGRGNKKELLEKPFQPTYQKYHSEDLHRLEIYLISSSKKGKDVRGISRTLVDSIDLPDNKRVTIKKRLWMYEGWRVQIAFGNGPAAGRAYHYYNRLKDKPFPKFKDKKEEKNWEKSAMPKLINEMLERDNLPRIKVYAASKQGPYYKSWPPKSHTHIYGTKEQTESEVLEKLATRAFRRPLKKGELASFEKLAKNSPEGLRTAIEAILCSADFLYLVEEGEGLLDHYAIANRLSYFLWNTMPDARLFKLASEKKLHDKALLKKLVLEMLQDPRSKEFVNNFTWAWLKLQNTVEMAPDTVKFLDYKRYRIGDAMLKETTLFFQDILDNNRPLATFVDADFAYVNADLARRYGIEGVNTTAEFQRIKLGSKSERGGLLTQTSVLTASSNGVSTSPVIRGIWILENLLGIHLPPPPDDVEIPEIDLRGKHTLKELYAKHRNVETCNSCHKKIDPLGFALENFNATGMWREKYSGGTKVDATGHMPDGTPFSGVEGLKQNMKKKMHLFTHALTENLLTYASGRTMKATDRTVIDQIVTKSVKQKLGLRDLILEIVISDIFLHK